MRTALLLGVILLVAGTAVLFGYATYHAARLFFLSHSVPVVVKVAVPVATAGMAFILGAVIVERLRSRKQERFEEVDY